MSSHGTASDRGRVYQAARDQHIVEHHHHYPAGSELLAAADRALLKRQTAEQVSTGSDKVVLFLLAMVDSLESRCAALEESRSRARAAGRAEALAEIQQELQASEERLDQAHSRLAQARREREEAERLRAEALREAEEYRRAYQELKEETSHRSGTSEDWKPSGFHELFEYDRALEAVDAELDAYRQELSRLSETMAERVLDAGPKVVAGVVVGSGPDVRELGPPESQESLASPVVADPPAEGRADGPQPRRRRVGYLITAVFGLATLLPLPVIGAGIRGIFSAAPGPAIWQGILFVVIAVPSGAFLTYLLFALTIPTPKRMGTDQPPPVAIMLLIPLVVVVFIASLALPPDATWFVGDWGHALVSLVGLGRS